MRERWLKCQVAKGMFSDECAISYDLRRGRKMSVFVARSDVRVEGRNGGGVVDETVRPGQVRVQTYSKGQGIWAILPAADQPCIPVETADLQG